MRAASPDRRTAHPSRGTSRVVAVRLKDPDARRLEASLDSRGVTLASHLRSLILSDLNARGAAMQ